MRPAANPTGASVLDQLPVRHARALLRVLERCSGVSEPESFRTTVVDAVSSTFGVGHVTFFGGRSFDAAFLDPHPTLTITAEKMIDEYQDRWWDKDVFASGAARQALIRDGFVQLRDLRNLSAPQRSYVVDYLLPHGLSMGSVIHLTTKSGDALVGMFDSCELEKADVAAMRFLGKQLRLHAASIVFDGTGSLREVLSPRQLEVAALVARGLKNADIAAAMSVTEQSVKKYMSRIFSATGCHNRAALAARVLTELGAVS
ncbi:MAG: helix-turn-helix transcriptional regulator [Gordonia sp. (in: high G+C Gram-positive bacteria)]